MKENNEFLYDEDASIKYIRSFLPQEMKDRFTDDSIVYILDLVDDYYMTNNIDIEALEEEEDTEQEEKMIDYIIENAKNDGMGTFSAEEIVMVLNGEIEYCESLYSAEEEE
jgi:hypothetical protein